MVGLTLFYAVLVGSSLSLGIRYGLKFTGLGFALACFVSFAWAARIFFARSGGVSRSQQRILASMYLTATIQGAGILYLNHGTIYHFMWGTALYSLSFVLFWSAVAAARVTRLQLFFSNVPPGTIVSHGPYRVVRHPFYVSYTLAWIAGAVIGDQPLMLILAAGCLALYYKAARLEEASFRNTPFAQGYQEYAQRVGMFVPRLPSGPVLRQWLRENLGLATEPSSPVRSSIPAPHYAASPALAATAHNLLLQPNKAS